MFFPRTGHAREFIRQFFQSLTSPVGKAQPILSYRFRYYFSEPVLGQATDLSQGEHQVFSLIPLWQNSTHELTWLILFNVNDVQTQAFLPTAGVPFPEPLWDLRFGPSYRQELKNHWVTGGNFLFGSASNEPFAAGDDLEYIANWYLKIPGHKKDAWFVFLNYSNNREFLNQIPLPGFAYYFGSTSWFKGLVGIPLAGFQFLPREDLKLGFFYFPARNIAAELSYEPLPHSILKIYSYFQWDNQRYFRNGRPDSRDRFFYYEKRVGGGVRVRPTYWAEVELEGGYAFDRFYFEGQKYSDRFDDRVSVGNGPFLSIQAGFRFGKRPQFSKSASLIGDDEGFVPRHMSNFFGKQNF